MFSSPVSTPESHPEKTTPAANPAATVAEPHSVPAYMQDVLVFDWKKQTFAADLVFVVPVAICLIAGILAGHPGAALISAGGAATVGFGAKQQIDQSRLLPMILASFGIAFSTFIGMIAGHENAILVPLAAFWGFGYGMLTSREGGYGWVGQQCVTTLLVGSAFPFTPHAAFIRALLLLAGGGVQVLCSTLLLRLWSQLRQDLVRMGHYVRAEREALRTMVVELSSHLKTRSINNSVIPYALRLMVVIGVSTEIYRRLHFSSGYWIPMTAMLVLKPGLADTASRAIARTVGTIAGAYLLSAAIGWLQPSQAWIVVFSIVFAWLAYATMNINYALFTVCITGYIVFLLSLNATPSDEIAHRRALCTAIGGAIALSVRLVVLYRRKRFWSLRLAQTQTPTQA
ncbi:FUSC family protein [Silvibacterium sp.]|uniref:FUSC family protein n=1 Tax=Silvibacterium sp. TaxID=1964179 RepID=UPI0039E49C06